MKPLVFANFLAPNMSPVYAVVAARVGRTLGVPAELVEAGDFDSLREGSVDVAFLCGLPYVRLCQERPSMLYLLAAPVLAEPRYEDRPVYFSDVIVRRDGPFRSFGDLRGQSWAYNDKDSLSGCLVVRYHLVEMGEPEPYFGRVVFSGWHQKSIQKVIDGEVDGSAIDSQVLGVERLRNPELDRELRVVAVLGPSPIPPVVATARVPKGLQARIRDALCELGGDPESRQALAHGLIRRFLPIDDRAYDDIREKAAAVETSVPVGNQLADLGA